MKIELIAHTPLAASIVIGVSAGLAFAWAQEQATADLDGWSIAYETAGEGDNTLVFIHGANSSRKAFYPQMRDLDVGRRKVAVDLLGHGDSDFSLSEADVELIRDDMRSTPKHVMQAGLPAITDPEIWRDDKIQVPLLVLLAKQPTWTPERIDYIQQIGPEVEYHMWEGVSHFITLERPGEFNELLAEFIGRLPGC